VFYGTAVPDSLKKSLTQWFTNTNFYWEILHCQCLRLQDHICCLSLDTETVKMAEKMTGFGVPVPKFYLVFPSTSAAWISAQHIHTSTPRLTPGSLNRVPALPGVKTGKSPLPGDPIWHVISHSSEVILIMKCYIQFTFTYFRIRSEKILNNHLTLVWHSWTRGSTPKFWNIQLFSVEAMWS